MTVDFPAMVIVPAALLYELGRRRIAGGRLRREGRWRAQALYAGLVALLLAVEPPLDELADKLFWAHMVQHMLLQMVAPPLIVLGAPWLPVWRMCSLTARRRVARWLVSSRGASPLRLAARLLGAPAIAWVLFIGTIAVSHLPGAFDFALRDSAFHEAEHSLFLGLGLLFWSRALDSPPFRARLAPPGAVVFFLTAIAAESVLALAIMGARSPLYSPYASLVPRPEGLSALADQQFGAAFMFEPASLPLLLALVWSIKQWVAATRLGGNRQGLCGQLEREGRALPGLRLDPDVAVHRPDQLAADVEPKAGSADAAPMVGVEAVELVEDPLLLAHRDPETLVVDTEPELVAHRRELHFDSPP
jgi:putative membrane protein